MRIFLGAFLAFAIYAFFGRWYYVCEIRGNCSDQPIETEVVVPERPATLQVKHNGKVLLSDFQQFEFEEGLAKPSLNEDNEIFLEKLAAAMHSNPELKLQVKANYRQNEDANFGIYDHLGIARFVWLEEALEERGIAHQRIIADYGKLINNDLNEPYAFKFIDELPSGINEMEFRFDNMTFTGANFAFKSAEFKPGSAFLVYADSLEAYFEKNANSMLTIVGHTDNKGTEENNLKLGKERADSAKAWLEANRNLGILIMTDSKGEAEPVANNLLSNGKDNEAGRAKNRRVNFVVEEVE